MRNRTHKWFVEQYNRNRKPSEWIASYKEIKDKSNEQRKVKRGDTSKN